MADIIGKFRRWRTRFMMDVPVEPDRISALSVVASLGVWIAPLPAIAIVLLLDLLDGAVARARRKTTGSEERGKVVDSACDHYSEFIIFGYYAAAGYPLLAILPVLNTAIALWGAGRNEKSIPALPLRHGLLLYLVLRRLGIPA